MKLSFEWSDPVADAVRKVSFRIPDSVANFVRGMLASVESNTPAAEASPAVSPPPQPCKNGKASKAKAEAPAAEPVAAPAPVAIAAEPTTEDKSQIVRDLVLKVATAVGAPAAVAKLEEIAGVKKASLIPANKYDDVIAAFETMLSIG